MNTRGKPNKLLKRFALALPIALAMVLVIGACAPAANEIPSLPGATIPEPTTVAETDMVGAHALMQEVVGTPIVDLTGETIAEVDDFMIDLSSGDALFAIASFDAMPDRSIPIPIQYLTVHTGQATLQVGDEPMTVIENAPALEDQTIPETVQDPAWGREVNVYWRNAGFLPTGIVQPQRPVYDPLPYYRYGIGIRVFPGAITTLSTFTGQPIEDESGTQIGEVVDLFYNRDSGHIAFITASMNDEVMGDSTADSNVVAMPLGAFTWNTETDTLTSNVTKDAMAQAQSYGSTDEMTVIDPQWNADYMDYWNEMGGPAISLRAGMRILPSATIRASEMVGYDVTNLAGESLGSVEDVIYNPANGDLKYAVLELGDFLGIGGQYNIVPVNSLAMDRSANLAFLNVSAEALENSPTLPQDTMLDEIALAGWDEEFQQYWRDWTTPQDAETDQPDMASETESVLPQNSTVTTLVGSTVANVDGEELGNVEGLMLNKEEATIEYAVLSFGGFAGIGDKLFAIPMELVTPDLSTDTSRVLFNVDPDTMNDMPGFDQSDWPDTSSSQWDSIVRDYWDNRMEQ